MSVTTIQVIYRDGGVLADPDSNEVFLSDAAAAYGVKRTDTDAVVVADNTQMTRISTGVYQHSFTDPAYDLTYQYATEAVFSGHTFREVLYKDGSTTPGSTGTLSYVREMFIKMSGRYDLVVDATDWEDNGADDYLNEGCRLLDRMVEHQKQYGKHVVALAADAYKISTTDVMALTEVWVQEDGTDARAKLQYIDYDRFRNLYPESIDEVDSGVPLHWTWAINRQSPENNTNNEASYTGASLEDYHDLEFGDHWAKDTILVGPPSDAARTITLVGKFYSPTLSSNGDINYWTKRHPRTLSKAACMVLENEHRNSSGAEDWMRAIQLDLTGIDHNMAEWQQNSIRSDDYEMAMDG